MKSLISKITAIGLALSVLISGLLMFSVPIVASESPEFPDLELLEENVSISTATVIAGVPVSIGATIWNKGDADANDVLIEFYEEDDLIGSQTVDIPIFKTWENDTVDSAGNADIHPSIASDDANGIHISYYDTTNFDLKYAYKSNGSGWSTQTVDSSGNVGQYTSLAIDDTNGVHISYFDYTNSCLKYAYKSTGGAWATYTVDSAGDVGTYSSIVVDGTDGVHISYFDDTNDDLKHAYKPSGSSWTTEIVDHSSVGINNSIAIDDADGIHISYVDFLNRSLKYAYKPSGSGWTTHIVDSSGKINKQASIAVDSANGVHISYYDSSYRNVKYAYKPSGSNWIIHLIDSASGLDSGQSSIAIDSADGVHISYCDDGNQYIKYGYKASDNNGSIWSFSIVSNSGDLGQYSSIAVDSANGVHVSYYDGGEGNLKYAHLSTNSWKVDVSTSWTPMNTGLRNITVKVDGSDEIQELDETNNIVTVEVTVNPEALASISVTPSSTTIALGDTVQFDAIGYDVHNNSILITPVWEVSGGGTMDENYKYTAIDIGTWTVYANQSGVSGIATVIIQANSITDSDSDGMFDLWEISHGLDPFEPSDSVLDPDLDGLSNLQELLNETSPNNPDTDSDSLGDGFEVFFSKTDPTNWDTNGNGIGDGLEFVTKRGYVGSIQSLPDGWMGMSITWDEYLINVKTSSSVLEGEFDKNEQKLKIKVSGPGGTQGITEMDIPTALCEPEDIEVMLDGGLIDHTLTQNETYYHIHIEYTHSTHELSADFGKVSITSGSGASSQGDITLYLLAISVLAIISILLLTALVRARNETLGEGLEELPPEKLSVLLEEKFKEGKMTKETYNDIKTLIENNR